MRNTRESLGVGKFAQRHREDEEYKRKEEKK
jgi:hypothetical protein